MWSTIIRWKFENNSTAAGDEFSATSNQVFINSVLFYEITDWTILHLYSVLSAKYASYGYLGKIEKEPRGIQARSREKALEVREN